MKKIDFKKYLVSLILFLFIICAKNVVFGDYVKVEYNNLVEITGAKDGNYCLDAGRHMCAVWRTGLKTFPLYATVYKSPNEDPAVNKVIHALRSNDPNAWKVIQYYLWLNFSLSGNRSTLVNMSDMINTYNRWKSSPVNTSVEPINLTVTYEYTETNESKTYYNGDHIKLSGGKIAKITAKGDYKIEQYIDNSWKHLEIECQDISDENGFYRIKATKSYETTRIKVDIYGSGNDICSNCGGRTFQRIGKVSEDTEDTNLEEIVYVTVDKKANVSINTHIASIKHKSDYWLVNNWNQTKSPPINSQMVYNSENNSDFRWTSTWNETKKEMTPAIADVGDKIYYLVEITNHGKYTTEVEYETNLKNLKYSWGSKYKRKINITKDNKINIYPGETIKLIYEVQEIYEKEEQKNEYYRKKIYKACLKQCFMDQDYNHSITNISNKTNSLDSFKCRKMSVPIDMYISNMVYKNQYQDYIRRYTGKETDKEYDKQLKIREMEEYLLNIWMNYFEGSTKLYSDETIDTKKPDDAFVKSTCIYDGTILDENKDGYLTSKEKDLLNDMKKGLKGNQLSKNDLRRVIARFYNPIKNPNTGSITYWERNSNIDDEDVEALYNYVCARIFDKIYAIINEGEPYNIDEFNKYYMEGYTYISKIYSVYKSVKLEFEKKDQSNLLFNYLFTHLVNIDGFEENIIDEWENFYTVNGYEDCFKKADETLNDDKKQKKDEARKLYIEYINSIYYVGTEIDMNKYEDKNDNKTYIDGTYLYSGEKIDFNENNEIDSDDALQWNKMAVGLIGEQLKLKDWKKVCKINIREGFGTELGLDDKELTEQERMELAEGQIDALYNYIRARIFSRIGNGKYILQIVVKSMEYNSFRFDQLNNLYKDLEKHYKAYKENSDTYKTETGESVETYQSKKYTDIPYQEDPNSDTDEVKSRYRKGKSDKVKEGSPAYGEVGDYIEYTVVLKNEQRNKNRII